MKIALFVASEKGYLCLKNLIDNSYTDKIGFVSSFKETNVVKSYDTDIRDLCEKNNIDYYQWKTIKNDVLNVCEKHDITIAFSISWIYLINTKINDIVDNGLIVFHDSLLPKYRGFAPTPTAIICGDTEIGVTALIANDGVDEGDIVLQRKMQIDDSEHIKEIINRQSYLIADMVLAIIDALNKGTLVRKPQNNSEATYSIWRSPDDCKIDWNWSAKKIYNFVRAVDDPYPNAFTTYKNEKIKIKNTNILPNDMSFAIRDTGKIWSIRNNCPVVICGDGMIEITHAIHEDGTNVVFDKLRERLI